MEDSEWTEWIKTTPVSVLEALTSLGPGSYDSEDSDDYHAYLCLSFALRLFPTYDVMGKVPRSITEFKAALTAHAMQMCTANEQLNHETRPNVISNEPFAHTSTDPLSVARWKALMSAQLAFSLIDQTGETFSMDGPRILALVEIVLQAVLVGMNLFSDVETQTVCGIYGSKEEASKASQLLQIIEEQCSNLAKQMGRFSSNTYFRLAECYLVNLRMYCGKSKDEAIKVAGSAASKKVQSSLNQFWSVSRSGDDNEESQESLFQSQQI